MSEVALNVKDAAGTTKALGSQSAGGFVYTGHYNKALPLGGGTPYQNLDVDETGAVVFAGPCTLYAGHAFNAALAGASDTGDRWLKLYDKATAPTSADTPKMTIGIGPGSPGEVPCGVPGIAFANGLSIRATKGIGVADTAAPAQNEVSVSFNYGS